MDERITSQLATRIFETICPVCVDRPLNGPCRRLAEGSCLLAAKLPAAAGAILEVFSDRMEPYTHSVRRRVCAFCEHQDTGGGCAWRDTDNCMLECFLPIVVGLVEELPSAAN